MVFQKEVIQERLKELDTVFQELAKYKEGTPQDLQRSLGLRWSIERGLIASATLVFDITNHILSSSFGVYPETYEKSIEILSEKKVISIRLYREMKGLGGLRNILVHEYTEIDPKLVWKHLQKGLRTFPEFSKEIQNG